MRPVSHDRQCRSALGRPALAALLAVTVLLALPGCGSSHAPIETAEVDRTPENLSAFGLFVGDGSTQEPAEGVIPYDINTPLFSDYSSKYRFVKLPPGTSARYREDAAFDFPVGTVIAKTFAYPRDMRDPGQGERLLETRVLIHEEDGWRGLPYIWNDEQTEATLHLAGDMLQVNWIHTDGQPRELDYMVPNANQCKACHKVHDNVLSPIGPKASQMNKEFVYAHGSENQLAYWTRIDALEGAPAPDDAPRMARWDDESSGTLDQRARAWLDANCAHCHNPSGPARNSGLDLSIEQHHAFRYGVFKPPVAAGRGSGGMQYDIVPGKPDESILLYRIASVQPDVMMPELGKRLVHEEGVALIREWIAAMEPSSPEAQQ